MSTTRDVIENLRHYNRLFRPVVATEVHLLVPYSKELHTTAIRDMISTSSEDSL